MKRSLIVLFAAATFGSVAKADLIVPVNPNNPEQHSDHICVDCNYLNTTTEVNGGFHVKVAKANACFNTAPAVKDHWKYHGPLTYTPASHAPVVMGMFIPHTNPNGTSSGGGPINSHFVIEVLQVCGDVYGPKHN